MYMAQRFPRTKQKAQLAWRITHMREWRESRKMTLEATVEALAGLPDPIETTHASLGRIERGLQHPPIGMIEALAALYKTDVDSMLNRRPGEADDILSIWRQARPGQRRQIVEIAKTLIKPTD